MSRKIFLIIICLLLAACTLPGQSAEPTTAAPQAWFDMPLPDTVFYPPNPCQVIAHGASPNGVAVFEFFINASPAASVPSPDKEQALATLNTACPPLNPGKNIIGLRVQDNTGMWSDTTQTIVFLAEEVTATAAPPQRATLTPAPSLQPAVTLPATGGVTVERVSTNLVYLGDATCGPQKVNVVARVVAPKGIKLVLLFYRFATANSSTEFKNVGMTSLGGDLYEGSLNPTALLGGVIPFDAATLQYQIVIQQNDGDTSLRTPVLFDIAVKACGGNPPPGSGGTVTTCSAFTDERTCIANGCNWVTIPGTVPIYECRAP